MTKPCRILLKEHISNEYTVRMSRAIGEADDFDEEFALLHGVTRYDVVKFLVTCPGGSIDTCNLLTKAIKETQAHTIGFVGSTCASAATAVILACEEWEIDSQSSFMIHTGTFGVYGKTPEIEIEVKHRGMMVTRWVQDTYAGFLTQEEINRVIDGKDYYFEGEELATRLRAFAEYRDAVRQAEREEDVEVVVDTEEEAA